MKKVLIIFSVCLMVAGTAFAQGVGNSKKSSQQTETTVASAASEAVDTGGDAGSDPKPPGTESSSANLALTEDADTDHNCTAQCLREWLFSLIFG